MTDTDVSGRLPAQPSTTDLNLWLVSRLKVEGSELTFGQIASIAKDLSAALRSPGGDGELVAALRDMPCIRPCNGRPDDFTVGQCYDAGECGCGNAAALSAAEATKDAEDFKQWVAERQPDYKAAATSAPTPAPVSGGREELARAVENNAADLVKKLDGLHAKLPKGDFAFVPAIRDAWPRIRTALTAALAAMPGGVDVRPDGEVGCRCQGCGGAYRVDITVPDELWNRIKPEGKHEGAGLLCGHCIVSRIEALEEFAVLTAALAVQPGSGWRPIETAPKDGKVLAYWPAVKLDDEGELTSEPAGRGFIGVAIITNGTWDEPEALNAVGSSFDDDWSYASEPTHWQPLPAPPTEGK